MLRCSTVLFLCEANCSFDKTKTAVSFEESVFSLLKKKSRLQDCCELLFAFRKPRNVFDKLFQLKVFMNYNNILHTAACSVL